MNQTPTCAEEDITGPAQTTSALTHSTFLEPITISPELLRLNTPLPRPTGKRKRTNVEDDTTVNEQPSKRQNMSRHSGHAPYVSPSELLLQPQTSGSSSSSIQPPPVTRPRPSLTSSEPGMLDTHSQFLGVPGISPVMYNASTASTPNMPSPHYMPNLPVYGSVGTDTGQFGNVDVQQSYFTPYPPQHSFTFPLLSSNVAGSSLPYVAHPSPHATTTTGPPPPDSIRRHRSAGPEYTQSPEFQSLPGTAPERRVSVPQETPTKEQSRRIPICWDHGCNGRRFSTYSNLLRHQRERAGTAAKSYCPRCGAEFTRTTARNGHLLHAKCKPRRNSDL